MEANNMRNSIKLSEKHGVNPMIPTCFYCNKEKNEIILFGKLPYDEKAPMTGVINMEPCDECKGYMEMGIILVSVRNGEPHDNPYRTGGWVVMKEEAAKQIFNTLGKNRFVFVEDEAWDQLQLPRSLDI